MAFCHFSFFIHPVLKFSSKPHLKWGRAHHCPPHKALTFTCKANKLGKNGKGSKPSKSNEELCNELREFMLAAGLPGNRVPTMKELSENGRDQVIFNQGLKGADSDENLTSEMAGERINQAEIDHLKAMLRQKEMELLELKQQIEKEKQSLSIMQDKANKEIDNARRMVTKEDMELHVVEEGLCGLKEVQLEYSGNGETVEVAGSFNGWHNRIKMDLHPSSKLLDSSCSRSLDLWSTILWLYPGIYEIKFVVDGTWRIDPNRETSTSCNIANNILRVDR